MIIKPILNIKSLLFFSISLTTTRVPSTSRILTCRCMKINDPSDTASIRSFSQVIIPAGLKSVTVCAVFLQDESGRHVNDNLLQNLLNPLK